MKTILYLLTLFTAACAAPAPDAAPRKVETQTWPITTLFPNYIVPLFENMPNLANGTQYVANIKYGPPIRNEIVTIVGFDVPYNDARTCLLKFHLPYESSNSWFLPSPEANLAVYGLTRPVNPSSDSWNHRPARYPAQPLAYIKVIPGQQGVVTGSIPCMKGQRMDFELAARRDTGTMVLRWFELRYPRTGITVDMY